MIESNIKRLSKYLATNLSLYMDGYHFGSEEVEEEIRNFFITYGVDTGLKDIEGSPIKVNDIVGDDYGNRYKVVWDKKLATIVYVPEGTELELGDKAFYEMYGEDVYTRNLTPYIKVLKNNDDK